MPIILSKCDMRTEDFNCYSSYITWNLYLIRHAVVPNSFRLFLSSLPLVSSSHLSLVQCTCHRTLRSAYIIIRTIFILIRNISNAVISAVHVTGAGINALVLRSMHTVDDTLRVRGGGLVDHGPQREGVHRNGHGHEAGKVDGRKGDKLHCCD